MTDGRRFNSDRGRSPWRRTIRRDAALEPLRPPANHLPSPDGFVRRGRSRWALDRKP
jgi:hypothetical protein